MTRTDAEVTRAAETTAAAIVRLVGERDRARDVAAALEAQVAAAAALHGKYTESHATLCDECGYDWPCPTLRALGAES